MAVKDDGKLLNIDEEALKGGFEALKGSVDVLKATKGH